jgi:HSP20 family protein
MAMSRYEPLELLNQLKREVNRLFDTTLGDEQGGDFTSRNWTPAVDIKEEPDRFILQADLPGVDAKDIEITMENGVLTLKGQRAFEEKEEKDTYRRLERVRGTFLRRFSLPDVVEAEQISARSKQGVLEVVIPKGKAAQPRKISIETGETAEPRKVPVGKDSSRKEERAAE